MIIDRVLAAKAFPGQSGGRQDDLIARISTPEPQRYEVIGVVDHQRHTTLASDGREGMFVPDGYSATAPPIAGRCARPAIPCTIADGSRALVTELNPRTARSRCSRWPRSSPKAQAQTKFALVLIGIFAGVALVLAAVGLYSVLSTTVRQRTAEIGVRMAFGAAHGEHLQDDGRPGPAAERHRVSALGIVAALLLTGAMRDDAGRRRADRSGDLRRHGGGFLVIAAVACGLPALRASRLDPMVALRDE